MATIKERVGVDGDLSYLVTISMGYKDGKQIRKNTTFIPPANVTRNKAKKLAEQFAADYEKKHRGFVNLNETQTLEKLCDWFLETVAPTQLRSTSLELCKNTINAYILPILGGVKLKEITPTRLDMFFKDLLENGRTTDYYKLKNCKILDGHRSELSEKKILNNKTTYNLKNGGKCRKETAQKIADYLDENISTLFVPVGEKTLSPNTVDRIRVTLSSIFSAAVKKEILTRNPVLLTNTVGKKQHQQAEDFLDENQAIELLNALENCEDLMFRTAITLTLFSGCRGGEICGLKWSCVDFEHSLIHIKEQLVFVPKQGYKLTQPKTENSIRYIPLPNSVMNLLQEWKNAQELHFENMVFTSPKLGYYSEETLNRRFKSFIKKLNFPKNLHLHSLRHTTASIMINAGIDAKTVSGQLGHNRTGITQDVYAHLFASSRAKAMSAIETTLTKPSDKGG